MKNNQPQVTAEIGCLAPELWFNFSHLFLLSPTGLQHQLAWRLTSTLMTLGSLFNQWEDKAKATLASDWLAAK